MASFSQVRHSLQAKNAPLEDPGPLSSVVGIWASLEFTCRVPAPSVPAPSVLDEKRPYRVVRHNCAIFAGDTCARNLPGLLPSDIRHSPPFLGTVGPPSRNGVEEYSDIRRQHPQFRPRPA